MLRHLSKNCSQYMTRRSSSIANTMLKQRRMVSSTSTKEATTKKEIRMTAALLLTVVGSFAITSLGDGKKSEEDKEDKEKELHAEENVKAVSTGAEENEDYGGDSPEHRFVVTDPEQNAVFQLLKDKSLDEFDITLYQYQVCPFCCKTRAFLDYHNIPYRIVEVNPITKSEVNFSKDYRKVPITMVEGSEQVNDSSLIITTLSQIVRKDRPQTEEEKKWRKWVDSKLVHVLPPNIYRTMREATEAFEYISDMNHFSTLQKYAAKYLGSTAMYGVSKRLKTRHKIDDEREALYTLARQWTTEALRGRTFHGGDKPDLADLAAYGVLSSIEGLQSFRDMVQNTDIGPWYERVKKEVGKPSNI